ncbi:heme exporter protein CcmD [Chitinibacteraceae bacterium HSL-7]
MVWDSWQAFFAMGKHGAYVWSAVAVCVIAPALEWALLLARRKAQSRQHERARLIREMEQQA